LPFDFCVLPFDLLFLFYLKYPPTHRFCAIRRAF
jgi:hypothetical protein